MHAPEAQTFAQRLGQAMQAAGLAAKPVALQKHFNAAAPAGEGISWQTAHNWLKGVFVPQRDKLNVLARCLQVRPESLLQPAAPVAGFDPQGRALPATNAQTMWADYSRLGKSVQMALQTLVEAGARNQSLRQANQRLRSAYQQAYALAVQANALEVCSPGLTFHTGTEVALFAARLRAALRDAQLKAKPVVLQKHFNAAVPPGEGISWQTACAWLAGRFMPQPDKRRLLAQWLGVQPGHFLLDEPSPGDPKPLAGPAETSHLLGALYQALDEETARALRHLLLLCAENETLADENARLLQSAQHLHDVSNTAQVLQPALAEAARQAAEAPAWPPDHLPPSQKRI